MNVCSSYKGRLRVFPIPFTIALLFILLTFSAWGAEYEGRNVDGMRYRGFVRSLTTGNYYPVSLVFDKKHAEVQLASGKQLHLRLDEQNIEDPEEVVATDPRGRWWALSVDGMDGPPLGTGTVLAATPTKSPR